MQPDPAFWANKRVCVTGGTGFLGWQLVRLLTALGARVRILGLRSTSPQLQTQLDRFDCHFGDVRDANVVNPAMRDCEVVFHAAGNVAVWGPALHAMHEIHAVGTQRVLDALPANARLIHTSSVVAVGGSRTGEVLTEMSPFELQALRVDYVHAKRAAEMIALQSGRDVVVVNPAYLIGPEDYDGSVMGRFCARYWKRKVPILPPGGLNFVDVRDVARGHLLAAEHGRAGQRYILGGENLTMLAFAQLLSEVCGMPRRPWSMPPWLQSAIAYLAEIRSGFVGREPYPSLQFARMSRYRWYYSSERARQELGYAPRSVHASLRDAHAWFCEQG